MVHHLMFVKDFLLGRHVELGKEFLMEFLMEFRLEF